MLPRLLAIAILLLAITMPLVPQPQRPAPSGPGFLCPMDRDVKTPGPGKCPRCGMKLVANLPDPEEYRLRLSVTPRPLRPEAPGLLRFEVRHPRTDALVRDFELVHERIFHAFLISADLADFAHEHPSQLADGSFLLPVRLARRAAYRVVADFFPRGGTTQFLVSTVFPAGAPPMQPVTLTPDIWPKRGANLTVELVTEPKQPIAGQETLLFFRLTPAEGLEQYLAAWGHMLVASDDLIDLIHDHPLYVDGVPPPDLKAAHPSQIQFNVIFPRERVYRVWVQFQRAGAVNTVAFNVPVKALR